MVGHQEPSPLIFQWPPNPVIFQWAICLRGAEGVGPCVSGSANATNYSRRPLDAGLPAGNLSTTYQSTR